jgi:excisionase family DNA binding protein
MDSWSVPMKRGTVRRSDVRSVRATRDESLTISEVVAELKVSRSTFYCWRQKGKVPRCIKLPNGEIRVRRRDLDQWLESMEEAA